MFVNSRHNGVLSPAFSQVSASPSLSAFPLLKVPNLAETVLDLFLDAINRDGNLWPSRIRADKGVENVLVCDAMVQAMGEGRGSFIAGPSTHN